MSKDTKKDVEKNADGLKRRRVDVKAQPVKKPLPIKLVKRRRIQAVDAPHSAGTLVLPTDKAGLTTDLRRAMINIAARIGNDSKNMKLLEETLDVLMGHVVARAKENKEFGVRTLAKRSDKIAAAMKAKAEKEQEVKKDKTVKKNKGAK